MNKTKLTHRFVRGVYLFVIAALLAGLALIVSWVSVAQAGQNGENNDVLSLSKSFTDDPVVPGGTVTLEFTLTNTSTVYSVTDIAFTDDLDAVLAGLAAVGLPAADVCGAGSQLSGTSFLALTGGSLAAAGSPGDSCTFSVTLQVPAGAASGSYTNTTSPVSGLGADEVQVQGDPATDDLDVQEQPGTIIVEKQTDPDGATGTFGFTDTITTPNSFSLSDNGTKTFTDVVSGTYTITETNPAPAFDLTALDCVEDGINNSTEDVDTGVATVSLQAGETVTCTFTNTQRGTIIVEKQTLPDGSTQTFEFQSSYGANFFLADGQTNNSGLLVPGTYSVAEVDKANMPAGWDLTSATCDDGSDPGNIVLDPGETVTCTFTNTQRGAIIVEKQTDPDGAPGNFTFTGDAAGTISDGGHIVVSDLQPGTYTSTEADPTPGFDLTAITCDDGNSTGNVGTQTATFNLDPGETVTCTFTNTQRGTIIVEKQTDPDGVPGNFTFSGDAAGTISDGGQIVVSDLAPGTYTSTEADPTPGFDLTAITCDDGSSATPSTWLVGTRTAWFKLDPGETVKCTFTNMRQFTLTVNKAGTCPGTVTSDPAGISCGADCTENYVEDTVVTLRAHPGVQSFFVGWSGDCAGTEQIATVTMDADKTCTATFGCPVGGIAMPVNKLELLALRLRSGRSPWMGLVSLASLAALAVALVRRRGG